MSRKNKRSGRSKAVARKNLSKTCLSTDERIRRALAAMRRGASLSQAARDNGVTSRTIKRKAGTALVQDRPGGRIRATKNDRLIRYLQIPGPDGPREIEVRGSKVASEFARYQAAVNRLLANQRGAVAALAKWRDKKIAGIEIVTDPALLVSQAKVGLLPQSLYRAVGGVA